ncbi:Pyridoxine/pyridoxamine 5'-phosphate oxidase 1 [Spatholobus suberectus]|nr:Pyridoxine/pyridoxamine 5'-phosphate oxidase 1 [Spatholobus suberectus]
MRSLVAKGRSMTCLCVTHSLTQTRNPPHATTFSPSLRNRNPLLSGILRPRIRAFSTNFRGGPTPTASSSALAQGMASFNADSVTYLTQREAAEIDETLMGPLGFSVDQLMELAGLSVATSISEVYKPSEYSHVLTICGPGNNGGDGLVAARHLHHFGYKPFVCYPKRTPKPLYAGLVTQLEALSIPFLSVEELPSDLSNDFDILVDAMFGFSFHGSPRPPFDDLIQRLVSLHNNNQIGQKRSVIISVDIPSGWHVEEGDVDGAGIKPDMLVSLTAPKLCAKKFSGPHHFLGGRFVPPAIAEKYKLVLPPYPGTSMCVRIGKPPQIDISTLRENYISPEFLEEQVEADPINQFHKWFDDALAAGLKEPNAMALSTVGKDGKPSSRMVLLKGLDKDGFVWYTNYESRKARELSENPRASLLFYWDGLNRQVRVEGPVQKVSDEESEQYFHSRPRGSQIGAIVSKQSTVVPGRHVLYQEYKELEQKYADGSLIPKPKNWGGYRLTPQLFEFWQGQKSRLHDRLQYTPHEINGQRLWKVERLAP